MILNVSAVEKVVQEVEEGLDCPICEDACILLCI